MTDAAGRELLGAFVKRKRTEAGLTQEQLAELAGVGRSWLSIVELDRHSKRPDVDLLVKLVPHLRVSRDELLGKLPDPSRGINVVGRTTEVRDPGDLPLPVYRWGTCGDPRDASTAPDPDHLEYPPATQARLIGRRGFGVMVKGDSMVGQGINEGDTVWVNPDVPYGSGRVVLANVVGLDGDDGMVVKLLLNEFGTDKLNSHGPNGIEPFVYREYQIIGRVVWVTPAGHPPGDRLSFNYA